MEPGEITGKKAAEASIVLVTEGAGTVIKSVSKTSATVEIIETLVGKNVSKIESLASSRKIMSLQDGVRSHSIVEKFMKK